MAKAKPKAGGKRVEPATDHRTRPVRLDLSPEGHRLLRKIAADDETSMAAYARDLVESHVREEAKRRGIKP